MIGRKFDWEDVESWLEDKVKVTTDLLCTEQDFTEIVRLQARIKVYRQILKLPTEDPNRGMTRRDDDD